MSESNSSPAPSSPPAHDPPAYIRFDKKQREEFLSQFGITAPPQRELFHLLCDHWRPLIDFDKFVAARAGQFPHLSHELENLVARLKSAKLGCLTYKKSELGDRVPHQIILCAENEDRYWFYFLQDLIQQAVENPRNPFLTAALLKTREILVPLDRIYDLPLAQLTKAGIEQVGKTEKLHTLQVLDERILVTSHTLNLLLGFASAKIRYGMKNPELAAAASRLLNIGLTDIGKKVEDKDTTFWQSLTEALVRSRDDLFADRRLHLEKSFFQAAELFRTYLVNQIEELKKQKADAKDRETDMRQLELLVLNDKESVMAAEELDRHMKLLFQEKYKDGYSQFKDDFYRQFTQVHQKTALPVLMGVHGGLVHRDNFYQNFVKRFMVLQAQVQDEFLVRMDRHLRTGNSKGDLAFVDPRTLEHAISDWVKAHDSYMADVFAKPKTLAEGLIHYGKVVLNMSSVDEMKHLMEQFFKPGVMTFRPLQEIFEVDAPALYEKAFKHLSVFSQFWRRLTGKYSSQAKQFAALALPKVDKKPILAAAVKNRPGEEEDAPSLENLSPEERKKRKEEWLARKREALAASSASTGKKGGKSEAASAKVYNQKEREKAWGEFEDTIRKSD